ncbi:MAG TPA: YbaK/EbsC family protein [Pirellulaceae bacterium]|nr:YbaK/EbsC family protein [Pirellulaceae bacterium]
MKIQELLRRNKVPFEILKHSAGASLASLADDGKISAGELAQVTLLKADHGYRYMLAVAALARPLELRFATRALEGCDLTPASDIEQVQFCPDCEAGGLMPFGSHYNVRTLLDQSLAKESSIAFEEIDGTAAIRMKVADFREMEHPLVMPLTLESYESVGH